MREIKFRAWDKERKVMLSCEAIHFGVDGEGKTVSMWVNYGQENRRILVFGENAELMQFTGLHDKNGKEIWEGDILAHTSWVQNQANGSPQDDFSDNQVIEGVSLCLNKNPYPVHRDFIWNPYRVVEYVTSDEFYQATGFFSPFVGSCGPKEYEVIGNIYENPELLGESKS